MRQRTDLDRLNYLRYMLGNYFWVVGPCHATPVWMATPKFGRYRTDLTADSAESLLRQMRRHFTDHYPYRAS